MYKSRLQTKQIKLEDDKNNSNVQGSLQMLILPDDAVLFLETSYIENGI